MNITAELLELSPSYINPLGLLQLDLRGNRIREIDNLLITRDAYEVLDLSDNDIEHIDNIPELSNLYEFYLCWNSVIDIQTNISEKLRNLRVLNLQGNKIACITQIECLSELRDLKCLVLTDNPICQLSNYREKILEILPQLEVLDYQLNKDYTRNVHGLDCSSNHQPHEAKTALDDLIIKVEATNDINELKRLEKLLASGLIK